MTTHRNKFAAAALAVIVSTSALALRAAEPNTLTVEEKAAGWKLLFDGKSTDGWRNYKKQDVSTGWKVQNGELVVADPRRAGDLLTKDQYGAFELSLDYKMSPKSNSGVIFLATEEGPTVWTTGPEIQLFDNGQTEGSESQLAGWLYQLYQPKKDAASGKPMDATKPAGEWNTLRLLVTPAKCEVTMNGKQYYEFVIGSDDWNERVKKSKFASMAGFGKAKAGHIALQGDHGEVSFRNIKIRPIQQ